jgi:hypothetical protein
MMTSAVAGGTSAASVAANAANAANVVRSNLQIDWVASAARSLSRE